METKDSGFFRNGKPFSNMAHKKLPIETAHPRDMAHQVDVPDLMPLKAQKISLSKNRRERVSGLTSFFIDLNTYISINDISLKEINKVRNKKARENGKFDKQQIGVRNGKEKLVRDKIPSLPPRDENDIFIYHKSENKTKLLELLDAKLVEEVSELVQDANTREKRIEELADIYEVMDAILKYRNIEMREINPSLQTNEVFQRRKLAKK